MKKLIIAGSIFASIAASPSFAFAQQYRGPQHDPRTAPHHRVHKPASQKPVIVREHRWSRNHVLPQQYRRNEVRDYRRHNLRAPGRHQRWVQVDRQYLLINSLTGMIVALGAAR